MFKSKRLTIAVSAGIFLALLAVCAVFKSMEGLASTCVAGILTIMSTYIFAQTQRPSDKTPKS